MPVLPAFLIPKRRKITGIIILFIVGVFTMSAHFQPTAMRSPLNVLNSSQPPVCEPTTCRRQKTPLGILNSSCSDESSQIVTGQKVISFSFYQPRHIFKPSEPTAYQIGILENLKLMRQIYPGFVMRVYTDVPRQGEFCKMLCENPDLHWCDIRKTPSHGDLSQMFPMTWRFLVLGDPTVDIFLSRDLDSILTEREVAAVSDWLNATDKALHTMRDNPYHNTAMLGGLWGASNSRLLETVGPASLEKTRSTIIQSSARLQQKGFDQNILTTHLHAPYKDYVLAHDSYGCQSRRFEAAVRPFPVQRKNAKNDFVGCPALGKVEYKLSRCPTICRPSYGKDWEYC